MFIQVKTNLTIQQLQYKVQTNMKKLLLILFTIISFTASAQVDVVGYLRTNGVADYPTHLDTLGMGGYMTVSDISSRDAIPQLRRKEGMAVYVRSNSKLYILKNATANTWQEFSGGGGGTLPTFNNGLSYNSATDEVRLGNSDVYTNIDINDQDYRGHAIRFGSTNELYQYSITAADIILNATGLPDLDPNTNDFPQWKVLVIDTPTHKISSMNMSNFTGSRPYYSVVGYFVISDNGGGQPFPNLVILENTFPNSHWTMDWLSGDNSFRLTDDQSGTSSIREDQYINAHFGYEAGQYHADAISVNMFPNPPKVEECAYWIQVINKNGNPQNPTNLNPSSRWKIYFEIRTYYNYTP